MFIKEQNRLCIKDEFGLRWIEPWGPDALRVRATPLKGFEDDTDISALLDVEQPQIGRASCRERV